MHAGFARIASKRTDPGCPGRRCGAREVSPNEGQEKPELVTVDFLNQLLPERAIWLQAPYSGHFGRCHQGLSAHKRTVRRRVNHMEELRPVTSRNLPMRCLGISDSLL